MSSLLPRSDKRQLETVSASSGALAKTKPGWGLSPMFIGRWNLSRLLTPMTYQDFAGITQAYHTYVSKAFGTVCDIKVKAHDGIPMTSSFWDPEGLDQEIAAANAGIVLTDIPSMMGVAVGMRARPRLGYDGQDNVKSNARPMMQEIWDKARHIELIIKPVDETAGPQYACAWLTMKGLAPRHASFYVQPYNAPTEIAERVCFDMRRWGKGLFFAEGDMDHAENISAAVAMESLARPGPLRLTISSGVRRRLGD